MNRANWYSVTTAADRAWKAHLAHHWSTWSDWHGIPEFEERAWKLLEQARAHYRATVLWAFWSMVAPIRPGMCVPTMVAELLAEDWDERTRWPA